jgi:hypothetical protein
MGQRNWELETCNNFQWQSPILSFKNICQTLYRVYAKVYLRSFVHDLIMDRLNVCKTRKCPDFRKVSNAELKIIRVEVV